MPGGGRQPTLCLPGPPLGGSEGIGFPERGDGNPLYTRMEILTLQKGWGRARRTIPFFYEMPLCRGRGNSVVSRDERGVVGGLTSDKISKKVCPVCVRGVKADATRNTRERIAPARRAH